MGEKTMDYAYHRGFKRWHDVMTRLGVSEGEPRYVWAWQDEWRADGDFLVISFDDPVKARLVVGRDHGRPNRIGQTKVFEGDLGRVLGEMALLVTHVPRPARDMAVAWVEYWRGPDRAVA